MRIGVQLLMTVLFTSLAGNDDLGFRLQVPPGWISVDSTRPELHEIVDVFSILYRGTARDSDAISNPVYSFAAVDVSAESVRDGFLENVTVLTFPRKPRWTGARDRFPWVDEPTLRVIHVDHAPTLEYSGYARGVYTDGSVEPFFVCAYVIPHDAQVHVVTFSAGPSRAAEIRRTARSVLRTFRVLPSRPGRETTLRFSSPPRHDPVWRYGVSQSLWDRLTTRHSSPG